MEKVSFIKRSPITGKKYDYFGTDIVRILNIDQAAAYLKNDVELIDVYVSKDRVKDKNVLVFVFDRESSKPFFNLWCKHELV